jgi:hypothetical protein
MLNCKQASKLLSQAQDQALGLRQRILLKLHLLACTGCSRLSRQLQLMRRALHRLRDGGE